ncbi:MAG: hypothetical protein WC469_03595 [Candidatus Omnitrophota bacterium]|jgi:hypothetical protein
MIAFILSGIFAGLAPNVYRIVEQDFLRRAKYNAKIEGLQYGDLGLRSGAFNTTSANPADRSKNMTGNLTEEDGVAYEKTYTNITVSQATSQDPNITISVNVTVD